MAEALNEVIASILDESQASIATHRKLVLRLRKHADSSGDSFLNNTIDSLKPLLLFSKKVCAVHGLHAFGLL